MTKRWLRKGIPTLFESGEYSDFGVIGCFLPLEDVDDAMMKEVIEAIPVDEWALADEKDLDQLLPALIRAGKVLEIQVDRLHIGSYSTLKLCGGFDD